MSIIKILIIFVSFNAYSQKNIEIENEKTKNFVGERISESTVKKTIAGIIASAGVPKDFSYKGVDVIYAYDEIKGITGKTYEEYKFHKKELAQKYMEGKVNLLFHLFQLMDLREYGLASPHQWGEVVSYISPVVKKVLSDREIDNNTYVDTLLIFPIREEFFSLKSMNESDDKVLAYIGDLYKTKVLSKDRLLYLEKKMERISKLGKLSSKSVYLMKGALLLDYLAKKGYKSKLKYKKYIPKKYPYRF